MAAEEQTWEERRLALIEERRAAGVYGDDESLAESSPPPTEPSIERISPDEAAYLGEIWARRAVADGAAALAAGVMDAFFQYLARKYELTQEDRIDEQGVITRVAATASEAEAE